MAELTKFRINGADYDLKDETARQNSGGNVDLGVTGAHVGQTVKIAEVDANGVPTAWLPTDFPSGGSNTWELIAEGTVPEETGTVTINKDINGEEFELISWYLYAVLEPCENSNASAVHTKVNGSAVSINSNVSAKDKRYFQSRGDVISGYSTITTQSCSKQPFNHTFTVSNFTPDYSDQKGLNVKSVGVGYSAISGNEIVGANSKYVLYGVRA